MPLLKIVLNNKVAIIKTLSRKEYLQKKEINPYLKIIKNNFKKFCTQKIQLAIAVSFMSLDDTEETHIMHCKSDNMKIMIDNMKNEIFR